MNKVRTQKRTLRVNKSWSCKITPIELYNGDIQLIIEVIG